MAAALVAKGSGDTDPRTLEVRLELGGGGGGLKGQHLGSTLTPLGTSAAPRALSKEASQLLLHSWPRG